MDPFGFTNGNRYLDSKITNYISLNYSTCTCKIKIEERRGSSVSSSTAFYSSSPSSSSPFPYHDNPFRFIHVLHPCGRRVFYLSQHMNNFCTSKIYERQFSFACVKTWKRNSLQGKKMFSSYEYLCFFSFICMGFLHCCALVLRFGIQRLNILSVAYFTHLCDAKKGKKTLWWP